MSGKGTPKGVISARGFSVLEILITLALLSIVLAIAYPSFQRYAVNGNLRTAARDLMADFAIAREKAMAENVGYTISFDVGNHQYTVQGGTTNQMKAFASYGATIQTLNLDGVTVAFQTRGTVDPGGDLTLLNSRGSTATITWNIAGRAYVLFKMQ